MNIKKYIKSIGNPYKKACNPQPGRWDSCEKCEGCSRRAKFPSDGGGPVPPAECCFLLEDNTGTILMETSGCLQPESC